MVNKENLSSRFLLVSFSVLLAVMIFIGLYPFNFFPPNRVQWVQNEPGLYFDGAGIAYTDRKEAISLKKAVSVELLIKERRGSKNWGPREIFSFYDGEGSPSLLVGQWSGRIFIFSRFEKNEGHEWYRLFRTKQRFPRGKAHLVTITFDESEKAIYIDGQLNNRKNVEINERTNIKFSGSFLLGNSHRGNNGWMGEIKGLAVYNRVLLPDEIVTHGRDVLQKRMSGLDETNGCLALYPFDEGEGNTAKSILSKPHPFTIPVSLHALGSTIFSLPYKDMRFKGVDKADFLKNIVFFVPFGVLFTVIILKKYRIGYFASFLIVTFAGGFLSYVIEGFQLILPTRYSGTNDIISNIFGSGLGMLLTFLILKEKS
jgi:VanZ family protein